MYACARKTRLSVSLANPLKSDTGVDDVWREARGAVEAVPPTRR